MTSSYSLALQENHPQNGPDIVRARILRSKRSAKHLADWIRDYAQLQAKQATELESFLKKHALHDSALGTLSHPWQSVEQSLLQSAVMSNRCAKRLNAEVEQPLRDAEKWVSAERTMNVLASPNAQLSNDQIDEFERIDLSRLESMKHALLALSGVESDRIQQQLIGCEAVMKAWSSFEPVEDIGSFSAQIVSGVAELVPATHASSVSGSVSGSRNVSSISTNTNSNASLSEALAKPPALGHGRSDTGQNSSSGSVNSRSSSQATVRRRTSFLLRNKHDDEDGEGHSVLSKVGSIFGRKKNKKKGSNLASVPDTANDRSKYTKPADFGLARRNSTTSYQSSTNSQFSGLPHPRSRPVDETASNASNVLSAPNSPFKTPATNPIDHANLPKLSDFAPSTPRQTMPSAPLNSTVTGDSMQMPNPLIPTTRSNTSNPASPLRSPAAASPVFRAHQPATTSPLASNAISAISAMPPLSPPAIPAALPSANTGQSMETSSLYTTSGDAPAPPPARQSSVHYTRGSNHGSASSIAALSSTNTGGSTSAQPRTSVAPAQRQQRVASQLFMNLNPARESNRDSVLPPVSNVPGDYSQPPGLNEEADGLGSLRQTNVAQTPGSPDQFWTPAQRFPKQFDNKVGSSTSLNAQQPEYPVAPSDNGLVAVSVESVDAEYKGDALVRSSVTGHALAVVHGSSAPTLSVGTLLSDANAKLTPCPLLKQITDLSFELPTNSYQTLQELCTYSINSAVASVPIKLTPLWRIENKTVRLVLTYQLSDLYLGGSKATIENLVISVRIGGSTRAISAQSKPVATFSREKQRVTWRLPQRQTLTRGVVAGKLLCQCSTEEPGAQPGPIELHARVVDVENSLLQLRTLSSANEWVSVPANVATDVTIHQL